MMSAPLEKLLRDARIDLVLSRIEKDPTVIIEVIKNLDSDIRSIKFNSINVLGELGQKSVDAISKIMSCLEDDDWSICREATRSLGKIGDSAKEAVPQISKLLEDQEESIRREAAIALGKIRRSTPESISSLIKAVDDDSEIVRTEVAKALGEIGPDAYEALPHLMNCLKDVSWTVRNASAQAINLIGKESTKAIPGLIDAIDDEDWRVRSKVVNALVKAGEPAVPRLLEILKLKNEIARKEALDCLGEMKITDPNIIEIISQLLNTSSKSVRGKAADALRSIGKPAIPALIKEYENVKTKMKITIISSLGGIGKEAEEAIPTLINILNVPEQKKEYIPSFVNKIKRTVLAFLKNPLGGKTSIRAESARSLGKIGIDSEDSVNALELALNDPKKIVRREAALSLGKVGKFAKDAIPSLVKALKDTNPDVRWRSSEALGVIGVNTDDVILSLDNLIHDKCDYVCESAINALDILTEE